MKENGLFSKKGMNSRITSANTQGSEKWLGYFFGPCFVYMTYYCVAGTYLTQFYTDVLHITGMFLTLMPVISKIIDVLTNIVMGRIIDRTRTKQGKARPWVLISGVFMTICGILLYAIPRASYTVQIIWVIVSYNLFFALAFTIYNMSHILMVPLSTRNTKQRDALALLSSTGTSMLPGMVVNIIMPILVAKIGVGEGAQGSWLTVMAVLSIFAIPATLLEYFFTKERVTEEAMAVENKEDNTVSMKEQLKACLKDPYWMIVMGFWLIYQIQQLLMSDTMLYYCNWVLGNSIESGAGKQVLVNMIGQAPLGIGVFLLWPLVRKFGKRKVMMFGFGIAALGYFGVCFTGNNLPATLGLLAFRSFGMIPTYVLSAQLAESLDHIEWKNGFRADGISASIYSIAITLCAGIAQSILLAGVNGFGYIAPTSAAEVITQPTAIRIFFTICFAGVPALVFLIGSLLMIRFDVEDLIPQISHDLTERRRAEAEERGEVYLSTEEKAAIEIAEQEKIAEEKRIEELKAKCEKKGLSFEAEEAKYQEKLAAKKAKEDAKKKK